MNLSIKKIKSILILHLSLLVTSCAIKPIPGDYYNLKGSADVELEKTGIKSNNTTLSIVEQIRCEARYSIAKTTMDYLAADLKSLEEQSSKTKIEIEFLKRIKHKGENDFDQLINEYYEKGKGFDKRLFRLQETAVKQVGDLSLGKEIGIVQEFAASGVGYNFSFTATEDNNASAGSLGFTIPRSGGNTTVGLGGVYTRQRQNERVFSFAETVEELVFDQTLIKKGHCNEREFTRNTKKNWHFPIYGTIGLEESFRTYAGLALAGTLGGNSTDIEAKSIVKNLTDTILFTTTTTGSATPALEIAALTSSSNLTSASIALSNNRIDAHQLILILQPNGKALDALIDQLEQERFIDATGVR